MPHLPVLVFFLVSGWLVSFGVGPEFTQRSLGGDLRSADAPTFLFYFWHLREAVLGRAPLFSPDWMFYPMGLEMIRQDWAPVVGLMSLPFQTWGPLVAYNMQIPLAYALSGFGMVLLARHLTGRLWLGLLAGIIFAFCEFRVLRAQHFGNPPMAHQEFIPLYTLFLLMFLDEGRWRQALGAGLCFFLATFISPYQMVFLTILTVLILGCRLVLGPGERALNPSTRPGGRRLLLRRILLLVLLGGSAALLPTVPVLVRNWTALVQGVQALGPIGVDHLDLMALVRPYHPPHPVLLDETRGMFLGYSVMLLLLPALLCLRRGSGALFWLLTALVFFLLSLGVSATLDGEPLFDLPFFKFLRTIPIIGGARTPPRFGSMGLFCLTVALVMGLRSLETRLARIAGQARVLRRIVPVLILVVVGAELVSYRFRVLWPLMERTTPVAIPPAYQRLAREPDASALLIFPLIWETATVHVGPIFYPREQFYLQTLHGRKLLGGMGDAIPFRTLSYFHNIKFIRELLTMAQGQPPPPVTPRDRAEAMALCRSLDIRHLLVHKRLLGQALPQDSGRRALAYLQALLDTRVLDDEEDMTLLEVRGVSGAPPARQTVDFQHAQALGLLGGGWEWDDSRPRVFVSTEIWPAPGGEVLLRLPAGQTLSVEIEEKCAGTPCEQIVLLNNRRVAKAAVSNRWQTTRLTLPGYRVRPGINTLTLRGRAVDNPDEYAVGTTGVRSRVPLSLESSSQHADVGMGLRASEEYLPLLPGTQVRDGTPVEAPTRIRWLPRQSIMSRPGCYNVAVYSPSREEILFSENFHLRVEVARGEAVRMLEFMRGLDKGLLVGTSLFRQGPMTLPEEASQALRLAGSSIEPGAPLPEAHCLIGITGAAPGSALETFDPHGAILTPGRGTLRLRALRVRPLRLD